MALLQGLVQRGEVRELLDDELERARALRLEILRRRLQRTHRHQLGQHPRVRHRLGVVGGVAPDLPQRPRAGGLDVVRDVAATTR